MSTMFGSALLAALECLLPGFAGSTGPADSPLKTEAEPADAGGGPVRDAAASPPPFHDLTLVRTIVLSGPCDGRCQPALVSPLSFPADGSFVAYASFPWSDFVRTEPRAVVGVTSWSDPAEDRRIVVDLCATNGEVGVAAHPDGQRLAVGGNGEVRVIRLDGSPDPESAGNLLFPRPAEPKEDRSPESHLPPACLGPGLPHAFSMAWTPAGDALAAALYEGTGAEPEWRVDLLAVGEFRDRRTMWSPPGSVDGGEVVELTVSGWLDDGRLAVAGAEFDDASDDAEEIDGLYRLAREGDGGDERRFASLPEDAAPFVAGDEIMVLDGEGRIRKAGEEAALASVELPPPALEGARRRILSAALHPSGRLAVVAADVVRVSVGRAPCCTRLLLYSPADPE